MHQYLNAIGFGNIRSKKELNKVLVQVKSLFTQQDLISQDDDTDFCEFRKEFGAGVGISLCEIWILMRILRGIITIHISWERVSQVTQTSMWRDGWTEKPMPEYVKTLK